MLIFDFNVLKNGTFLAKGILYVRINDHAMRKPIEATRERVPLFAASIVW